MYCESPCIMSYPEKVTHANTRGQTTAVSLPHPAARECLLPIHTHLLKNIGRLLNIRSFSQTEVFSQCKHGCIKVKKNKFVYEARNVHQELSIKHVEKNRIFKCSFV